MVCNHSSNCICGNRECDFQNKVLTPKHPQNFIFTPKIGIAQCELLHVLTAGVRAINISIVKGTREEHHELIQTINWAIKIFLLETKFNFRITKVCTVRGRVPRTGRMRNKSKWKLTSCHEIVLTTDKKYQHCSTAEICYVSNFQRIIPMLRVSDVIKINSEIALKIVKISLDRYVTCKVVEEGCLGSFQEVKVRVVEEHVLSPTEEELDDCEFVRQYEMDFVVIPSVNSPEQFHKIKELVNGAKLIAQIDPAIEKENIDRIVEHFYGVFVGETWFSPTDDYVVNKARESMKMVVSGGGSNTIEVADSLLLKPVKCGICIHKINKELTEIMKNPSNRTSIETNQSSDDLENKNDNYIAPTIELSKEPNTKAIVSLTQKRKTVEIIAHARPPCPIILLTECPSIAKQLQLWRNVNSMVYVDCDNKEWKDKRNEMMEIAGVFGKEMKIFDADELLVTCCFTDDQSVGNRNEDILH